MPFLPTRARDWCNRHSSQSFRNFHALKNISFTVRRGESVGIIGRNGSGKSTLLQIIAGTLMPTEGEVTVNGSVAALLELGSGFNPEFTGRENVYMNAAIRGMSKEETDAKFGEIVAFADIGDFVDQPTKTYSSGMLVRLAFAVSVCVEPELLIVDEALSVGDVFFQQKCFQRIHTMLNAGPRCCLFRMTRRPCRTSATAPLSCRKDGRSTRGHLRQPPADTMQVRPSRHYCHSRTERRRRHRHPSESKRMKR